MENRTTARKVAFEPAAVSSSLVKAHVPGHSDSRMTERYILGHVQEAMRGARHRGSFPSKRSTRSRPLRALDVSTRLVAVPFVMFFFQWALPAPWGTLGILPRTEAGLIGVLFSPLLHGSLTHLLSNATPLFVLLLLLFSDDRYRPEWTLVAIWLASGLGTWAIGRGNAVHIGASGIVFGLISYLIASGLLMQSWRAALVALVVLVLFGGVFYGLVPQPGSVSWEGHLCGAVAGVWSARGTHGRRHWRRRSEPRSWLH